MRTKFKSRGVVYHRPKKELDEEVALLLVSMWAMGGFLINGALHARRKTGL